LKKKWPEQSGRRPRGEKHRWGKSAKKPGSVHPPGCTGPRASRVKPEKKTEINYPGRGGKEKNIYGEQGTAEGKKTTNGRKK